MIVLVNMFAKLLTENGLTPLEVLFYRNIGGFALVTLTILSTKQFQRFKTKRPKAQFIRALTGNLCLWLIIWANALLPLATVSAILLSAPIIATVLSPLFFERKNKQIQRIMHRRGLDRRACNNTARHGKFHTILYRRAHGRFGLRNCHTLPAKSGTK
ncbi:MAG: EamA family transporter [Rhodospirillales bacterium]|nr:EamA family transporter [Rhodospirillales bacterium]